MAPPMARRFFAPAPTLEEVSARPPRPGRRYGGTRLTAGVTGPAPAVSIVTVVRNGAGTIEDTLRSILAQEVPDLEYVVVDGGSTDGTLDILRRYQDRLALWISEGDDGISDALNKGIALTTGNAIGILHADDRYMSGAITASLSALAKHPEAGFSYGHCRYLDGEASAFLMRGDPDYARVIETRMPAVNHPTMFVRRQVYQRFGLFRPGIRVAMDYDLLLRFHLGGVRGVLVPEVIAEMRLGGLSVTQPIQGHWECLLCSIEQGVSPLRSGATFAVSATGALGRLALERVGAKGAIERLRKLRYPTVES
jgi:cellulose synthase/poly-beta-1,6-N-acetylglucosamine synthase-like glycosyltransferase